MDIDEKSCGIVLFHEENGVRQYLLLKYLGGHFDFPKGHVEEGETEHETAARELLEETGIEDLQFFDGFREEMFYTYRRQGRMSHKMVVYYVGKTTESTVKISHEHLEYVWLPYKAAYEKITFKNSKDLLDKAEKFLLY